MSFDWSSFLLASLSSEDLWASVSDTINTGLSTALEGTQETLAEQSASLGSNIVKGIIQGINDSENTLKDQLQRLARAAVWAAKNELKIESPSKVFRELGRYTSEGFALGIDDSLLMAESAAVRMVEQVTRAGAGVGTTAGGGSGPVINLNLNKASIRSDEDVRKLSNELGYYAKSVMYGVR